MRTLGVLLVLVGAVALWRSYEAHRGTWTYQGVMLMGWMGLGAIAFGLLAFFVGVLEAHG